MYTGNDYYSNGTDGRGPLHAQGGSGAQGAVPAQEAPAAQGSAMPEAYTAQNAEAQPQTPATQQGGWVLQDNVWTYSYAGQPEQPRAPKPKTKKKRGGLKVASLLLACTLLGFGGGAAAVQLLGTGDTTVVYRNTEGGNLPLNAGENLTLSDVAEQAGKSVVSITTENMVTDRFFGNQVMSGAGSGVVISEDGVILTNHHVIDGASNIIVTLQDGTEYSAKLLGSDAANDIAVLKIEAEGLTPAVLGDSDSLRVGEFCLAIGNPMGNLGGTVTDGIISALDRNVTIDEYEMNLLQMSAAVSPGNSGGGLFNAAGQLVGIVNAKSGGENTEGLGFAIPINKAMDVAQQLMEKGYVSGGPGLGITVLTLDAEAAAQSGYDKAGVYINYVNRMSAAEKAGLQVNDRIVSADGVPVETATDLTGVIKAKEVGDTIELVVERGGEQLTIQATLGELISTS